MFQIKLVKNLLIVTFAITCLTLVGCSNDDDDSTQVVAVTVNGTVLIDNGDDFIGDIDGGFTGNGGSGTKTFMWQNSASTAEYNADITATSDGIYQMEIKDADGTVVLDRSLSGATDPDSFSGVTTSGTAGIWSVVITLTTFNGEGSFSISEGN